MASGVECKLLAFDATCSQSGSDHRRADGTGCFTLSSAIRSASLACRDAVGRNASVGQETNYLNLNATLTDLGRGSDRTGYRPGVVTSHALACQNRPSDNHGPSGPPYPT
jgi:hypothetical protein